jgi:hypothetical protein
MEGNIDAEGRHKCAQEQCRCQVPSRQEYCSDNCFDADDVAENVLTCRCGHTPCALDGMDA